MSGSFDDLDLAALYRRTSEKWSTYGPDVLPLWVAEMDFPLADPIQEALHQLVERSDTGYGVRGPIAESFAGFAARRYGWPVDPQLIWPCVDVMTGVEYVLDMLTEPGAPVVFLTPAYPPFFISVSSTRRAVSGVPLAGDAATGWTLDLDRLAVAMRDAGALLLCNPHNPTGRRFTRDELLAVAKIADRYGVPVICDEIHAPLVLDPASGPHVPFAGLDAEAARRSVCFHSASKGWNVAGLKAALIVAGSPEIAQRIASPQLDHRVGLTGIAGIAASIAAFDDGEPWLDELIGYLAGNHRLVQERLPQVLPGAQVSVAEAGYLAWLDLRAVADLPGEPAHELLDRARVALVPGPEFGAQYRGWARMNVGTSRAILTEALARIEAR